MSKHLRPLPAPGGGAIVTPGPYSLTDFGDVGLWLPIGSPYVLRTIAPGGMTLAGNAARSTKYFAAGALSLFRVFGDPLDNDIDISITFDQYVRATDLLANDEFRFGMWWIAESDRSGNDNFSGVAYGGVNGAGNDFFALEQMTPTDFNWVGAVVYEALTPAASWFVLRAISAPIVWSASFELHAFETVSCTMDGGGGPLGGNPVGLSTYVNMPCGLLGFRLFVGVYGTATSITTSARVTGLTVTKGRVVAPF